jgi:hypothetical protein
VTLALLIRIAVEELVNTTGANSSGSNALATVASPGTRLLARTEGFDGTCDDSGLRCLRPLAFSLTLLLTTTASAARA